MSEPRRAGRRRTKPSRWDVGRPIGPTGRVFLAVCAVLMAFTTAAALYHGEWRALLSTGLLAVACFVAVVSGRDPGG